MDNRVIRESPFCPIQTLIDCLTDKWVLMIMFWLQQGPRRFGQLRRDIPNISQKMLSQTLKRLERDGLVARGPAGDSANGVDTASPRLPRR